jgi:hypothetical protein
MARPKDCASTQSLTRPWGLARYLPLVPLGSVRCLYSPSTMHDDELSDVIVLCAGSTAGHGRKFRTEGPSLADSTSPGPDDAYKPIGSWMYVLDGVWISRVKPGPGDGGKHLHGK